MTQANGPSIWAIDDGRAGHAAQVNAITAALTEPQRWLRLLHIKGEGHKSAPVTVTPSVPWTLLPGINWPLRHWALPKAQRGALTPPWPTLCIAAGRRSAPYSAMIKHQSGSKSFCIQLLNPRTNLDQFDLVIAPEHDGLTGDNVVSTIGSAVHFTDAQIEDTGQMFVDLADQRAKSIVVILGGHSGTHRFTTAAADALIKKLTHLSGKGWRLRITTSRRTPIDVSTRMRAFADTVGASFWSGPDDGPNPYLGWLLYSQAAIVTEDSANLLSDAAWHGLPTYIAELEGKSEKFNRLHSKFVSEGYARWLKDECEIWSYTPLREAERVADIIVAKLLEKYPAPVVTQSETASSTPLPDWFKD